MYIIILCFRIHVLMNIYCFIVKAVHQIGNRGYKSHYVRRTARASKHLETPGYGKSYFGICAYVHIVEFEIYFKRIFIEKRFSVHGYAG